jgi:hypothetical protein
MATHWMLAVALLGGGTPRVTSDPRPTPVGAPHVSFLTSGCRLEITQGGDWHRLWLNCGRGPHLLSEPSSLMWHVRIRTPEQALELLRLFSSPDACQGIPAPQWVEITSSDRDGWLALNQPMHEALCPTTSAHEIDHASSTTKRFLVTRCLLREDGDLYSVDERVRENGETEVDQKTVVLPNAKARIGSCNPFESSTPPSTIPPR